MRNNFTQSEAKTLVEKHSQTHAQASDSKILIFVQKIVNVMGMFFKDKNVQQLSDSTQKSGFREYSAFSIGENTLQEYFIDQQQHKQLSNNVPDLIPNQDLTMDKLSFNSKSTVKEYRLGSQFDANLKRWTPSFSSPIRTYEENEVNSPPKNSFFKGFAATIMLMLFTVLGLSAQTSIDLSLRKDIDNSLPVLNGTVKYTLWLKNSGPSTANSIVVQDNFPIGGANLVSHTGGASFSYTAGTGIGLWSVASLKTGDSVSLVITATVLQRGVFFNTAEVKSVGVGQDIDSTPNNSLLYEDDFAASCFSVPLYWYPGEEYTVSVPAPYKYGSTIKWFNGSTEITQGSKIAVVNADSSLTIKAPGNFTFTTNVTSCPAQGCCAVQIIEGPYGSLGDYVFADNNSDGIQNAGDSPISGIKVYLLDASGTKLDSTTTNGLGKYEFDSLLTGNYKVKFVLPAGSEATGKFLGGNTATDSNINPDGTTDLVSIDTDLPLGNIGRNNPTIDAGIKPSYGSIGDYVWTDTNNDGQQAGESPIAGVKVYLLNASGTKIDSTTTNALGKYLFDSLATGTYRVQFIAPVGSIASKSNTGNDLTDSDPNKNGLSHLISINTTLSPADTLRNNPTIDAGFVPVGSIGDYVFSDNNSNGIQDAGDNPVSGVKVYLLNALGAKIDSTITNGLGKYEFDSLLTGTYSVKFVLPVGSESTGKFLGGNTATDSNINPDGSTDPITINTALPYGNIGRNNPTIDAGIKTSYGSIGDYVWEDKNNDGVQNDGNTGIKGVIMELYASDANGNPIGSRLSADTTDADGYYLFPNLIKGDYVVKIVTGSLPSGTVISAKKDLGGDDAKDSDFAPSTGLSQKVSLDPSNTGGDPLKKNNLTIDAGIYTTPLGSIGDYVWKDLNNNGLQDDGNTGVSGVIIELYASDAIGLPIGLPLKKDTTDANGKYLFTGLPAGNYVVKVVTGTLPVGSQLTSKQDIGLNDAIDSDFNPSTGLSDKIVIDPTDAAKKDILTVDGGIYSPLGSIGDYVWKDTNNNGIQDDGSTGVSGVKVELYASDASGNPIGAALQTTTTNGVGYYNFGNLAKGDYVVKIVTSTLPATYLLSTKTDLGGDDTKDSDFNATTGLSPKISIDPLVPALKDNPTIDGAIYMPVVCSELIAMTPDGDICVGDTTYIKGTVSNGGKVKWFLTPIGGTAFATTNSGASYQVFPTTTTVYYAEIENAPENCPNPRQPVVVTANARPSVPSCAGAVEECLGKTVNLNNYIINGATTPGGVFEWHTTANPNSPLVANPTAVGAGTYYLFEKSGAGCYSNPVILKVTLKSCDKLIDLSLVKSVDNLTPNVGDNLTYTIKVTNAGPDAATNVEVTDILPAGLQFVSSSFFINTAGVLTTNISNIAAGQTIILNYIVKLTGTSPQTNFAQVTKADQKDIDSTPGNGSTVKEDEDDKVTVTPKVVIADLSLNKTVSNSTPNVGDNITYYIDVTNSGTSNATNVEASDIVPAGLQVISATGGDVMNVVGNSVTAKFNQINVGQTVTFQIVAKVTATSGTIKNWAQVTKSDQQDSDSTPNNGTDKGEDDDDDADIIIKQAPCNPTTPLIACSNPYICLGESVSIEAIGCNGTIVWSDGQTGSIITVTPSATTTYTAQCKINDNCISPKSNSVTVVVNVIAAPLITSNSTTNSVCNGGSIKLTANCTGIVTWSTGATGATLVVSPTTTTSYTAICKKGECVSGKSNVITVTVGTPSNPPTITANNSNICAGQSATLTASGCAGIVTWSNGQTGNSITVTPSATATYTAICKVGECPSAASAPITITVGAGSTPTITATKDGICAGESTTLTASNCTGNLSWSTGATTATITVTPATTTTYEVKCGNGECVGKATKTITVTPKPTIPILTCGKERICAGESLTFTAHGCDGVVTWSTGVTGATMTVTPTVTTTYTATCTVNGCASDPSKPATITVINQTPPTITASSESVCSGGSVTLTASNCAGTVLWSTGATTAAITVTPVIATTYTVKCIVEECESSASKTITIGGGQAPTPPTITASQTSLCGNDTAILTAAGCAGGTIKWSTGATTASITVSTAGVYSATCVTSCGESVKSNVITITTGNVPSAPIIAASKNILCGEETATLTASGCTGTLKWNTGATTSQIIVGVAGTYSATCANSCGESVKSNEIIIQKIQGGTPIITATNETVCKGGSVTLTISNCSASVLWSTGATTASITVTPTATTTYTVKCNDICGGTASKTITVSNTGGQTPTITATKDGICVGESVTLTASNCTGTLTWSTGATTASITVTPSTTTTYEATCSSNGCSGKGTKVITVTPKPATPIVTCGKERICAGESLTFTAHGCEGVITWSTGVTGATMTVTPMTTTTYTAVCTVNGCASDPSKPATITVINQTPPTITATADAVCNGASVVLTAANCAGTVLWSTGATTFAITVTPIATTTYTVKCIVEECESSASKTITIGGGQAPNAPVITASKESVCGNETATLTASGCTGSVKWSTGAAGLTISVGAGTYSATCTNECGESAKSNVITITSGNGAAPTISATTTSICEAGNVTLTAAGCSSTVVWSNGQTGNSITVNVATTTTFSAMCKSATCESGKSNEITVTVGKPNKPTISSDKTTICAGDAVILTAAGCAGTTVWSNGLTGSPITVTPTNTTDYTAVCKLPQGGCTSDQSNKVTVTVTGKPDSPTISCSASRICEGDTLTLNALGCSGTVLWSTGQTSASISVNPSVTTVYTAICKVGSCESAPSAAATINVGKPIPPVVSCKNTQICSGSSTQIEAAGCTGTVKWSDGQIGAVITVSPLTLTSYSAICDGGRCQSEKSNIITVQVTGSGLTKPTTKDLVNLCPYTTVDLTTGVTSQASSQGGVFVFRTGTTPGSPAVTNTSAAGTGTYYVFEKAGNGCYSEGGKINANITSCEPVNPSCATNPATAKAGKDSTVCISEDFFTLKGQIGGSASSAKWTTTGKGSFENALSLTTKYKIAKEDVVAGSVSFTLTTNDPDDNGSCVAASSTFKVTLNGVTTVPTITSDVSPNICFGDSVVITAAEAGTYKWSNGATTKSITVKTTGRYSVKLLNQAGCASLSSNEIVVNLGGAIAAPSVAAITKNTCPATTVNLNSAVTSQVQTQGGVFEFHTGSAASSPMLANATAVGAGTYYVIEKSTIGCTSPSSPIIVTIDECITNPADTSKTELSIVIIGSRVELKIGDPITYTITVKNNSTKTATNVNVVNVLPKGLAITSATPGFTAFGTDSLLSVIGSLPGGATKTYTYDAKTTKAGVITNTAKITKLDQIDPITSNNISQWSVECKTCQETCVGLAFSADTTRQANGSYNITFRALIEACGNVKLEGVKITENLATMFPAPTTFTIVQKPTAGVGSKLITNDSFNGSTDLNLTIPAGSEIEPGKVDTVKFVINIVPNGKEGPFSSNALAEAVGNTIFGIPQDVSDVSNDGKIVDKPSATPTVVKLYKSPSIGLAKIVLDTTKKANGSYDITYQLLVKNNGSLTLNDVIVRDTLSKVFKAPATFTVVGTPMKNASSQLAINAAFNGSSDSRLTLAGSTIAIGKTDTLKFVVNVQPDTVKSFANTAVASASGLLTGGSSESVTDLSNAGNNPDAPGSNPTNLNIGADAVSIEVPCIGIALYVKDTLKQPDGSYNITYNAVIKNCGNLNLTSVQVCDTLSRTFNTPAVATIIQKPTASAGSQLKVDNTYDGITNTCMLLGTSQIAPNKVDTLKWVINVQLNGNKGPFRNTVIVTAKTPSGQVISDASNAGIDPNPVGSTPTVINFNSLPEALIGISKDASEAVKVAGTSNTYDVTFTFKVKNYGKTDFTGIQVQDNLSVTFGDSVKIDSVNVKADTGFKVNPAFTGRGSLINLLVDSLSTLPKNTSRNITLFTRVTLANSKNTFENQALAIGKYPTSKSVDDLSTKGTDPDPDADGNPKNNSIPTPVKVGSVTPPEPTFTTTLGIAKAAVLDSVKNADGTYNVTYTVIVKNYGIRKLTNVQLSDSLGQVFADSAEFVLVGKPTLNKNSKLKIDSTFNGRTISTMLKADSSTLAVGASDTLTFKLRLLSSKQGDAVYSNTINGTAKDSTTNVKDISQAGLNADPDGDKNPGNNNQPTVITIKGKTTIADSLVVIPGGFSPNGDGNGDKFVITGINGTDKVAEFYVYNRWGQLIYQSTDFGKETGWDGVANNGLLIGSKAVGVPDGTYYYCVKATGLWEEKPKVGFMTIAR